MQQRATCASFPCPPLFSQTQSPRLAHPTPRAVKTPKNTEVSIPAWPYPPRPPPRSPPPGFHPHRTMFPALSLSPSLSLSLSLSPALSSPPTVACSERSRTTSPPRSCSKSRYSLWRRARSSPTRPHFACHIRTRTRTRAHTHAHRHAHAYTHHRSDPSSPSSHTPHARACTHTTPPAHTLSPS